MKPFPVQEQVCVDQYAVEYTVFDRVQGNRVDFVLIVTYKRNSNLNSFNISSV